MARKRISQNSMRISLRSFLNESDKGCAIVVGTALEDILEGLHEAFINANISDVAKFLKSLRGQYGPLSTFSGMIQIAYAYGLVPEQIHRNLEIVRRIRNEAAHSPYEFSFEDPGISAEVRKLDVYPADDLISDSCPDNPVRSRFIEAAMTRELDLLNRTTGVYKNTIARTKHPLLRSNLKP